MREILFRGKRVDIGEWAYGSLIIETNPFDKDMVMTHIYDNGFNEILVDPRTIGQYTGVKDKNGRRIFENGYMIIDDKTYKVIFDTAEYILTNIFNCDIITLKNNSIKGVFVDEI